MTACTFVHAADLHLDAPFQGLRAALLEPDARSAAPEQRAALAALVHNATFTALNRLVEVCLAVQADFLLLAGDVYNTRDSSLRARLALRRAFARLQEAGIQVFLVHGNHDPLTDSGGPVAWPENVCVFGGAMETRQAVRNGAPVALVHGISHTGLREGRNLARLFRRRRDSSLFQIGLLHAALTGASGEHAVYAPCTLADLAEADLDYWALGHVHTPCLLARNGGEPGHPYVVYPGSLQGLHVNESGPRGCVVVRVDDSGRARPEQAPLAPVRWEVLEVDLGEGSGGAQSPEGEDTLESLLDRLVLRLEKEILPCLERSGPECACGAPPQAVLVRVALSGATALDRDLRLPGSLEDLARHLEEECARSGVWIRDIHLDTRPLREAAALAARADLVGEVVRTAARWTEQLQAEPEAGCPDVLAPLFRQSRVSRQVDLPDPAELASLVRQAQYVCLDLLEGK